MKDEERTLPRCLNSIRGAVDEIVVVDTGSTDDTKNVAAKYTSRIFDFAWQRDFAAARQFAFNCATSDWVGWLDADDVVVNAAGIRAQIAGAGVDVGAIYWPYVLGRDAWGNETGRLWRERCVRSDGSFSWVGRVHEVLVPAKAWNTMFDDRVIVEHFRDPDRGERGVSPRRNLEILEEELVASGEPPSTRVLFYLANEYSSLGDIDLALATLYRYLAASSWDAETYVARAEVARLLRRKGEYHQAIDADWEALKLLPRLPDAYFGLAESYYYLQEWDKVIHWSDIGRQFPIPEQLPFVFPMRYRYEWIIFYTVALNNLGRVKEALVWTEKALAICPQGQWHVENAATFRAALAERDPSVLEELTPEST